MIDAGSTTLGRTGGHSAWSLFIERMFFEDYGPHHELWRETGYCDSCSTARSKAAYWIVYDFLAEYFTEVPCGIVGRQESHKD